MEKDAIASAVCEAGVVGAGGAGFPTHVKLKADAEILLINAAECEPLLHVDIHLLIGHTEEVMEGIALACSATGARRAILGIKGKYRNLEKRLKASAKSAGLSKLLAIAWLPNEYPMGDEHVLVKQATGRTVPPGGIPLSAGVVVMNVETLLNVSRAAKGIPVTTKFLTLGGDVAGRFTTEVPIGLPVEELLRMAGRDFSRAWTVIDGGPMMGKPVGPGAVVTKTTKGILVFPCDHPLFVNTGASLEKQALRAEGVCCQCRSCTDVCPRYRLGHDLEPHRFMRAISRVRDLQSGSELSEAELDRLSTAFLCSECGACESIGCRMDLSPRAVNRVVKAALASKGLRYGGAKDILDRSSLDPGGISSLRLVLRLELNIYDLETPFIPWEWGSDSVSIPLRQHVGVPSVPVVEQGVRVVKGQLLADVPEGKLGARIHSSAEGKAFLHDTRIEIQKFTE